MKINIGDIFTVPLTQDEMGFGQIVAIPDKSTLIVAIFAERNAKYVSTKELTAKEILFLGYTLDAKLYHKHWKIIDNYKKNISKIYLPFCKLGSLPNPIYITDYKGKILRVATPNEIKTMDYQTVIAPIRYENALKAYFKILEWKPEYDLLLYTTTLAINEIVQCNNKSLNSFD